MNTVANALTIDNDPTPNRPARATGGVAMTPMEMLSNAVQSGASIETLEKLMGLHERWETGQSRKAFDAAMAAAKAEIPVVGKNAVGHNNKRYANFAAYAETVTPILAKHGLSFRFRSTQTDRISVTCIITHEAGHAEENTLHGPADKTGSKNDIQAIGSTLTYLQRYTLVQALGLAASEDDDGQRSDEATGPITEDQASTLRKLIEDNGRDIAKFCEYFKIDAIPDLPAKDFARAVTALSKKVER